MTKRPLGRLLPLLVPIALAAAAVAAFLVTRSGVEDQEDRILRERTAEVELVLENAIAGVPAGLRALGVAARLGDDPEEAFRAEGRAAVAATGVEPDVALVRREGDAAVVTASLGETPAQGTRFAGERAAAVEAALSSPTLVTTPVFRDGDGSAIGFAMGPPTTPRDTVIWQEAPVSPRASAVGRDDAFHEIKAVVYASPEPRRDQIIIATTDETLRGDDVARGSVEVGDRTWLLLTSPRESLVGSLTTATPWIVLGGGLLGAALVGAVVLVLVRRRDYALHLVEERTAELQRSLSALEDAQQRLMLGERLAAIGQVAAAVGHELRAPLGALTRALERIREDVPAGERYRVEPHLQTAEREVTASATIVESLLDFAREREPATASVDLVDLLDEALSVAPPPARIRVERQGLDGLPQIRADRRQLRQVLLNLLSNGYEAMDGDGGTLTLDAHRESRNVVLRVADTGAGMDEETAERIFEPFFTTKAQGIGLGLPVTRRIIEMHGGSITAESTPGEGTAFVVSMPVMAAAAR
jgi:signal transduction histidine kinase